MTRHGFLGVGLAMLGLRSKQEKEPKQEKTCDQVILRNCTILADEGAGRVSIIGGHWNMTMRAWKKIQNGALS